MRIVTDLLKTMQIRIGIVFAFFVPLVFLLIWMTGYNGAAERVDQLKVGLVSESAQNEAVRAFLVEHAPFQTVVESSKEQALARMDSGETQMVIIVPAEFERSAADGGAKLTYYVNDRNSEFVKSVMQGMTGQLTAQINRVVVPNALPLPIQAEVVKTNEVSNFSTSMLPMILGFIPYIAMMTMNIQFNIASQILGRRYGKWELFFSRQVVLAGVAVIVPLVLSVLVKLFLDVSASFWQLWGFEMLVFAACICTTQMAFAILGNAAPLFNVFLIPFMLMTAGNIIAPEMLSPFYRYLGSFLPASNGVQGGMHLVFGGGSILGNALNLLLIVIVTWGLTVLRLALTRPAAAVDGMKAAA